MQALKAFTEIFECNLEVPEMGLDLVSDDDGVMVFGDGSVLEFDEETDYFAVFPDYDCYLDNINVIAIRLCEQ